MDQPGNQYDLNGAVVALQHRCTRLRLPAWHCDADGRVVLKPGGFGDADRLLAGEAVTRRIADAARGLLQAGRGEPAEVMPGWLLLPLVEKQRLRRVGVHLVAVLTPASLDGTEFDALCREASAEPDAMRSALRQHVSGLDGRCAHDPDQLLLVLEWSHDDLARAWSDRASIEQFSEKLTQSYEEVNLLYRLAQSLKCLSDPKQMMQITCDELLGVLPFTWVAIAFQEDPQVMNDLAGRVVSSGQTPDLPKRFEAMLRRCVTRHGREAWDRTWIDNNGSMARLAGAQVVAEPIHQNGQVVGALLAGGKTGPQTEVTSVEIKMMRASADFLGVFHDNGTAFAEQKTLFMGTLRALTASIDAKDQYTCGHSERVALLCRQLALATGMSKAEAETAHIAGLMHDVGKIGIPERVLGKAGRLNDEEFELVKQHSVIGHRILSDIPQLHGILDGVLHHHERYDGLGYPDGLAGKRIPLLGRIIAIADTFDAMSSNRSYRSALARPVVLDEIRLSAGTQLDPELVGPFLELDFEEFDRLLMRHQGVLHQAA